MCECVAVSYASPHKWKGTDESRVSAFLCALGRATWFIGNEWDGVDVGEAMGFIGVQRGSMLMHVGFHD